MVVPSPPVNQNMEKSGPLEMDKLMSFEEYKDRVIKYRDLNKMVDDILATVHRKDVVRKRVRFSKEAQDILFFEYRKNPAWDLEFREQLSARLNLNFIQIYKWYYDQRKKG